MMNSMVLISGLFFSSCYYDIDEELYPLGGICDTTAVSFAMDVLPIIQTHCTNCHSGGSPSGSISLSTHSDIEQQALSGLLLCTMSHADGCSAMPQNAGKLPDCNISKIQKWIENGALNN
ncbi:MAG: hypothetical protein HKN45_10650 [Flavobacteriales bacterium]|nr:hypothetical protein [Flavobacteriales bacterium]NNK80219.1 hypothetical protein [Flavobacteriales bacterium]